MHFIHVNGPLAKLDRVDAAEVVLALALIVECHAAVALEVGHVVSRARCVDG